MNIRLVLPMILVLPLWCGSGCGAGNLQRSTTREILAEINRPFTPASLEEELKTLPNRQKSGARWVLPSGKTIWGSDCVYLANYGATTADGLVQGALQALRSSPHEYVRLLASTLLRTKAGVRLGDEYAVYEDSSFPGNRKFIESHETYFKAEALKVFWKLVDPDTIYLFSKILPESHAINEARFEYATNRFVYASRLNEIARGLVEYTDLLEDELKSIGNDSHRPAFVRYMARRARSFNGSSAFPHLFPAEWPWHHVMS